MPWRDYEEDRYSSRLWFLIVAGDFELDSVAWPCLVYEEHHREASNQTDQEKCSTFLAGTFILAERPLISLDAHDNDKVDCRGVHCSPRYFDNRIVDSHPRSCGTLASAD